MTAHCNRPLQRDARAAAGVRDLLPPTRRSSPWRPAPARGADDRRIPHQPDRAQPAGAGGRHVSDLQQHDLLGGAAAAAVRHAALPGRHAAGDRRAGAERGAAVVGAVGVALGLGLGILLGQGAVRLVTQTINDLYFVVTVRGVAIPPQSLIKGASLRRAGDRRVGGAAGVGGGDRPATAGPGPFRPGREGAPRPCPWSRLAGVMAAGGRRRAAGAAHASLVISFAGIFFVTIGFALLAPFVTLSLLRRLLPVTSRLFGVAWVGWPRAASPPRSAGPRSPSPA